MIHWKLTSLQFEALLLAYDRDRVPYPIRHACYGADDELRKRSRAAIDDLLRRVDESLSRACALLVRPEVRVLSHARVARGELRAHAGFGRNVAGLAIQEPDPEPEVCGDVTVTLCTPADAGRLILDAFPDTRPGTLDSINVVRTDLSLEPVEFPGGLFPPPTLSDRVDRIFQRDRTAWGEFTVCTGDFKDNRVASDATGFFWMDFAGDGRYFVRNDHYLTAIPADRKMLSDELYRVVRTVHRPFAKEQ